MMMVLEGKLLYLKMVKGEKDSVYVKLKERFDKLTLTKNLITFNKKENNNILDLIFEVGLNDAMKNFKV